MPWPSFGLFRDAKQDIRGCSYTRWALALGKDLEKNRLHPLVCVVFLAMLQGMPAR